MTAGDVPQFRGGIQNDAAALNDLARRVGMLEATRYAAPLQQQQSPAGSLVSLIEAIGSGTAPTRVDGFGTATATPGVVGNLWSVPVPAAGTYILFGAFQVQVIDLAASPGASAIVQLSYVSTPPGAVTLDWTPAHILLTPFVTLTYGPVPQLQAVTVVAFLTATAAATVQIRIEINNAVSLDPWQAIAQDFSQSATLLPLG